jgi:hypothetical protein
MEELYDLPDGSQVDISDYSQFEKTSFLMENPRAKKLKGVVKSANVTSKKPQAQNMESARVDGSLGSQKFRLAGESDLTTAQKRGVLPPPSAQPRISVDEMRSQYDLKPNIAQEKAKFKPMTIEQFGTKKPIKTKIKLSGSDEELKKFVDNFSDNPVTGQPGEDTKYKVAKLREKIQLTDSELEHPYMYYSSVNQEQPDDFIEKNYNKKELETLGINTQDFDGYLNKKGYKDDFLKKEAEGLFEGEGRNAWTGYNIGLARELSQKKMLNMYMEDMQRRDFTKQDLNQDIEIVEGNRQKKDIVRNELFDTNGIAKYVEKNFPIITEKLKERDTENAKIYQESKKGGTDFFSWDTAGKMAKAGWNSIVDRTSQLSASAYQMLGMEGSAEGIRFLDQENKFLEPDDRGMSYVSGKSVNYDGTKYIVDSKGDIYDADAKIRVTDLFDQKLRDKLVEDAKYGPSDWAFSAQGAAVQTSGVMADMLIQAAVTHGIGELGAIASETRLALNGARKTSAFTSLLNDSSALLKKIPLDRATGYSMIAQGTLGYSQGYEETLKAARDNGINDKEAFELAGAAAQRMAVLYGTTGVINPQTKVVENIFGEKAIIKKAIDQYTKTGPKGFISYLDDMVRNTPRNLVQFAEEGGKEVIQENTQQLLETKGVNATTNRDAGKKIMNETFSADDFMNTSMLSFISAGLMSKVKLPSFHSNDQMDDLMSLSTLAKNKNEFTKIADGLVAQKVYTTDQVNKLKEDVNLYANNINKVPKEVSPKIVMPIIRELDKVTKLQNQKESTDKAFHEDIDKKIEGVRDNIKKIFYTDQLETKNKAITKAIEKGVVKNIEFKNFETTKQLEDYLVTELGMDPEEASFNAKQRGFMAESGYLKNVSNDPSKIQEGKKFIFVNDEIGLKRGVIDTSQHEFLHGLLRETLKDPETQILLGTALAKELTKLKVIEDLKEDGQTPLPKEFMQRFNLYTENFNKQEANLKDKLQKGEINQQQYTAERNAQLGNKWEEALTLYSDAISNGTVKYDEGVFSKLKDTFRQVLQYLGLRDIKFESGRDVYNFIKDYNKSMESGYWGKGMKKLGTQGSEVNKQKLREETGIVPKKTTIEQQPKFSLDERKSSEQIKKDVNKGYNKEKWSVGSNTKGENPAINNVLYDILSEYEYIIKGKAKALGYANLPDYSDLDMISETQMELIPHIRNFNKEFFQKREEYKKELEEKGLDPKSQEFKDKVEEQDQKGYKGKKGIVKENDDLNAWINSQLVNKMGNALRSGNVTTKTFTEDIEGEGFKEKRVLSDFAGETGEESDFLDESDSVFDAEQDYEVEQSNLAVLLSDPIYKFVDEKGNPISIETIPFGGFFVTEASDPTVAANKKLKTETDAGKISDLTQQLIDLERGLELQSKKDITPEEREELKSLKSFKSYDLSTGMMVNTFEALSIQDTPAKIITDEVGREILRSPNIETLEFRNFKEKLSTLSKTMARRMTFKSGPEIESLMYNQWELLYDVINHPVDPVTGESSYASKKLPPRLKEFDEKGNLRKIGDISRVKFLQSYYGIDDATRIIKTYGGKNANEELAQLEEPEVNDKTGKPLWATAYFDRRTALMELFGDVLVLQEARRLIREPEFLNRVADRNVNLYNDLKDDVIRAKVLNDMAKGKSSSVKFSLAEEENGKISNFLEDLSIKQQFLVARDIDEAIVKAKTSNGESVKFVVPSRSKFSDKSTAYFIIDKAAQGYNDFEFAVKKNSEGPLTKQVLNSVDIKSEKVNNMIKFSLNLEEEMNNIIEQNKGIKAEETFSAETAKNLGKNIGKNELFLPPQDEDFLGLLYTLASAKGKTGEEQLKFLTDNLLKPYSDAMLNLMRARQVMYKDWNDLINKKYKGINKTLKSDSGYGGYLTDQAVRVYLWKKAGYEIPGLDKKDIFHLVQIVRNSKELRNFAEDVSLLSKQANGYIEPDKNWGFGSIVGDINDVISKSNRKKYLEPWVTNVDKIFSKQNLNKIEAVYGRKYVNALNNIIARMKTGSNRVEGGNDAMLNWINGATAVTMFANVRSAVLQTLGAVNYINTSDNNVIKAGAAFLNVPQYLADFKTIWNSEYLVDRRSGLMNDVAEAELAQIMNDPNNKSMSDKFKAANYWLLKNGYAPTRYADSFAIAFGGAGFYRNRLNTYKKEGMTDDEAEKATMRDFYETSEASQQSADVSKISSNQASIKGRLLLSFLNTPFQYSRIIKRSVIDLAKGRGSAANNIAKIVYYSTIQNIFFNFMQNALFSLIWDDDEEKKHGKFDAAKIRTISGAMDTLLRGSGMQGVVLSTAKNVIIKWYEKHGDPKGYGDVLLELTNISPSIGIKTRALVKSYKAVEYNMDEIRYKGFSLDNKYAIEALTSLTSATTNIPVDRLYLKMQNVANALDSDLETWQRIWSLLGYSGYNLGIKDKGKIKLDSRSQLKIPELSQGELKSNELK